MAIDDRYRELRAAVTRAILDGDGALGRDARKDAYAGDGAAGAVAEYVHAVRDHAYRVTDEMVGAVRAAGWGDDQIFEATVATALGKATRKYDAALAALEAAVAATKK